MENNRPAAVNRIFVTQEEFVDRTDAAHMANFQRSDADFQCLEISGVTLKNRKLRRAEFNYAKLSDVCFRGVDFDGAEFRFCEFCNVSFFDCKLESCGFDFAVMDKVNFARCLMNSSSFDFASGNAVFAACSLEGAEFHHTGLDLSMTGCNGGHIEINSCPGIVLQAENCDFHQGEFLDGTFRGAVKKCVFSDADFSGSDGRELVFSACGLRAADTRCATGIGRAEDAADDDSDIDFE